MWVKNVKLKNFRNYKELDINLGKNINIFYGENAQGKTNIIESIFLCSMGKSFRTNKEKEMINIEEENCCIEIEYEKSDREGKIKIQLSNKKNIFLNNIKIKKLSELLGNINIVIFTPDDIEVIKGGPQNRRKFLDIMISQLRPNYMHTLTLYKQTIDQRNNYLKQIKEEGKDENLLEIWDEKLAEYAIKIYNYRKEFIEKIREKYDIIPICPEQLGGLKTPRVPSEIKGDEVYSKENKNVTSNFLEGSRKVANIALYNRIKKAILQE